MSFISLVISHRTAMNKITPFLWFDHDAEEAASFYTSIFKKNHRYSSLREISGRGIWKTQGNSDECDIWTWRTTLYGVKWRPAISFFVNCNTQQEVDELWKRLSEGGEKDQCGWLKDKFGVSWQIIPNVLGEMLQDKEANKSERVMKALLQMKKIDIQGLRIAYEGQ